VPLLRLGFIGRCARVAGLLFRGSVLAEQLVHGGGELFTQGIDLMNIDAVGDARVRVSEASGNGPDVGLADEQAGVGVSQVVKADLGDVRFCAECGHSVRDFVRSKWGASTR
jgi:hypothetical protein